MHGQRPQTEPGSRGKAKTISLEHTSAALIFLMVEIHV